MIEIQKDYDYNMLDLFRVIATVQVFLGHFINSFIIKNAPVNAIYFIRGVPILFVLCGFLAGKSLEHQSSFIWLMKRAIRILPAMWVCIFINTIVILCVYNQTPTIKEFIIYILTQFFGLNFYTGDWLREYGVGVPNGVLWTIPVQIQFFIIAPIIHKFLGKKISIKRWCTIIGALSFFSILLECLGSFIPSILYKLISITVFPYLYFLLLGMMFWYCRSKIIQFLERFRWFILLLYLFWKFVEFEFTWSLLFNGVLYNVVTTLLLGCTIFAFAFRYKWRLKEDWTFGFYLYHMVFINIIIEYGFEELETLPLNLWFYFKP